MNKIVDEPKNQQPGKRTGKRIALYFYMILILLLLATVASYTWFSLTRTPMVSQMALYVTAGGGMELAEAPEGAEWRQRIDYPDLVTETTPLRPITWSERDQSFYAAVYGMDGRVSGKWMPLSDERNANRNDRDGYYCIATFYARAGEPLTVSLAEAAGVTEGTNVSGTYLVGEPEWDETEVRHLNVGRGAENAVRVGIKITAFDEQGNLRADTAKFYVYEPNCNAHIDGTVGYVATPSIDGTETLVPSERLLPQTLTSWVEADPVEKGVQFYTFGAFTSPIELFKMEDGQKVQISLYIWLEGQDVDCTNALEETRILANIQFDAVGESGTGLVPVE